MTVSEKSDNMLLGCSRSAPALIGGRGVSCVSDQMQQQTASSLGVIWGGRAIAAALGREEVATYKALEQGHIPGARKVGGRWCFDPDAFRRALASGAAA